MRNKRDPDDAGSYAVSPSVGDLSRRGQKPSWPFADYSTGTYIAVPHPLLLLALERQVGRNGMFVLIRLLKYLDKKGHFLTQPSREIQEQTGMGERQIEAGVSRLKKRGIIATLGDDRSYYAHSVTYQLTEDARDRLPLCDEPVRNANKEAQKRYEEMSVRWGAVNITDIPKSQSPCGFSKKKTYTK